MLIRNLFDSSMMSNIGKRRMYIMIEQQAKQSILCDLRVGSIQPFQVAEQLRLKGISSFEIKTMKKEILETYRKEHPCY